MVISVRHPFSSPPRSTFDSGVTELRQWRQERIGSAFDNTAGGLLSFAVNLTGDPVRAEEILVQSFLELGNETSVLAEGLPSSRRWLLRRVARHCLAAMNARKVQFSPATIEAEPDGTRPAHRHLVGRALFNFLSPGSRGES